MKHPIRRSAVESATAIALLLLVAACGGKQTIAVKSAEAFRDAQQKGVPVGGDSHGGHSAGGPAHQAGTTTNSAGGHATMTGMDHSTMAGNSQGGMAGMDHSKMKQGQQPMAGMDHSKMQQGQRMPGMDHGNATGMQHGAGAAGSVAMSAPITRGEMQGMSPAATLRLDDFDAPVAISVSEAMKATQGGGHGISAAPPINPVAATVYACPMHPEVTSDKPGSCPKCGMALVKK